MGVIENLKSCGFDFFTALIYASQRNISENLNDVIMKQNLDMKVIS